MANQLTLRNQQRRFRIDSPFLKSLSRQIIEINCAVETYELGIILISANRSQELNQSFLQHKGPTDIITFDYAEESSTESNIKGELLICPQVAETEATRFKTSWQAEIVRYIIHGILHLQGYDDLNSDDRRVMKVQENRIFKKVARDNELTRVER